MLHQIISYLGLIKLNQGMLVVLRNNGLTSDFSKPSLMIKKSYATSNEVK